MPKATLPLELKRLPDGGADVVITLSADEVAALDVVSGHRRVSRGDTRAYVAVCLQGFFDQVRHDWVGWRSRAANEAARVAIAGATIPPDDPDWADPNEQPPLTFDYVGGKLARVERGGAVIEERDPAAPDRASSKPLGRLARILGG